MGMFDYIEYKGIEYQTKDTPHQLTDRYKIEVNQDDGHTYLWHEAYNAKWVKDKSNKLFGYRLETSNHHWECCHDFDGAIDFYRQDHEHDAWIEFHSLFMDGKMLKLEKKKDE
jgi:hypothetical protein